MINMNIIMVATLILNCQGPMEVDHQGHDRVQERVLTKPIEQILEIVVPMIHEEA